MPVLGAAEPTAEDIAEELEAGIESEPVAEPEEGIVVAGIVYEGMMTTT